MAEVGTVLTQMAVIETEIIDPVTLAALYAYPNPPLNISMADMPCFVNKVGALVSNQLIGSDDLAREFLETRNYNMYFYLSSYGSGIDDEQSGLLTPYFELVYVKFGQYPKLKNLAGVVNAIMLSDSGTGIVSYAGQMYNGIMFTLQVTTKVRRILSTYE